MKREHPSCGSRALRRRGILTVVAGTGEHGVGVGKKEYLTEELGESTIELMRTVKRAIDPLNIMNPGKVRIILPLCSRRTKTDTHLQLYPDEKKDKDKEEKH